MGMEEGVWTLVASSSPEEGPAFVNLTFLQSAIIHRRFNRPRLRASTTNSLGDVAGNQQTYDSDVSSVGHGVQGMELTGVPLERSLLTGEATGLAIAVARGW
jgi:hypothetical protein